MTRSTRDPQPTLGVTRRTSEGVPSRAPLPSLLDGRPYVIRDSGGVRRPAHVTRSRKSEPVMTVPMGAESAAARIRLHEMAHVRWTPLDAPLPDGVDFRTINACEDRRIHRRLSEQADWKKLLKGAPILRQADLSDMERRHLEPGAPEPWDALEAARWVVASDGTAEQRPVREMLDGSRFSWVAPLVDQLMDESGIRGRRPTFKSTADLARALEDLFAPDPPDDPDAPDPEGDMLRMLDTRTPGDIYRDANDRGSEWAWGRMQTLTPPLVCPLPRDKQRIRRRRATDTGAIPRNWHRAVTDGCIFTVKRNAPGFGGTVLIDQSGSMALDPAQVMALLEAFPAVTVATYAGRATEGTLKIIAARGRRASEQDCYLDEGGNTVDGPALEWLAGQAEPRVWVSDGLVVGSCQTPDGKPANQGHPALLLDAARICKRGRIRRVDALDALIPEEQA